MQLYIFSCTHTDRALFSKLLSQISRVGVEEEAELKDNDIILRTHPGTGTMLA